MNNNISSNNRFPINSCCTFSLRGLPLINESRNIFDAGRVLFCKFTFLIVLSSVGFSTIANAVTRNPELSYSGYKTATDLKMAIYSGWVARFGYVNCGFERWSWIETSSYVTGVPQENAICGYGHRYNYYYKTKVCAAGYVSDNSSSPNYCELSDGQVDITKDKGTPENSGCAPSKSIGNPVNLAIGNKFQEEHDYVGVSGSLLNFSRTYNSHDGLWRHNYSAKLRIAPDNIILVESDGRESYFSLNNGVALPESDEFGRLIQDNGLWVYTSPQRIISTFDEVGRLIHLENSAGEFYSITHQADLSEMVSDGFGNVLTFSINKAAGGQSLKLVVGDIQVNYSYDSLKRLVKRSTTRNGVTESREYMYGDSRNPALLTGINDERGVRFASWAYDEQGRATSSEHAGGAEKTLISYNTDDSTTVTNPLGKQTTYQFQTIQGVKHITSIQGEPSPGCPMSNSTFTYDDRGLLTSKTDNKGIITTYDYNERGLEISRTEAAGTLQARTTTTTWHTTLSLPLTVTEPGRVTTYTYDTQGRQLSLSRDSNAL